MGQSERHPGGADPNGTAVSRSTAVAVLSPVGRDASLIVDALAAAGIPAFSVPSAAELLRVVSEEVHELRPSRVGVLLTTDQALGVEWSRRLTEVLDRQAPWSDIPIILLAGSARTAEAFYGGPIAQRLPLHSSITVLDRPVRVAALVSAVRAARRARSRQIEVRELIEVRDRALADAERANRAKSEYLAVMSHELRAPLNAIMGHVQITAMGVHGPVTAEQRQALGRIEQAQGHILRMIEDLLNYARIDAGRLEYRIRAIRLQEVVDSVLGIIEARLRRKHLNYSVSLPERDVILRADPDRLRQILLNLLGNAAKFTPPEGRVEVIVDDQDPDVVRIQVTDTGIGIPADKLEAIFDPFVQAHPYAPEHGERGTGLGLAISREMVRAMGGDLSVTSMVGSGSTFVVTLPTAQRASAAHALV